MTINLIIGNGQIGSALFCIFKDAHETYIRDIAPQTIPDIAKGVLHIAYPYSAGFERSVEDYVALYRPRLTIIHSSVPVGTTDSIKAMNVVYSPVRGRHPFLVDQIPHYVKWVAGNSEDVDIACDFFGACGLETQISTNPKTLEFAKMLSNVHMGLEIAWKQETRRMAQYFGLSHQTIEEWEQSYQDGYLDADELHLIRPMMKSDPIGGHCILECMDMLDSGYHSLAFDFIRDSNERRKQEVSNERTNSETRTREVA